MSHHTERDTPLCVSVVVPSRDGGPLAAQTVGRVLGDTATTEVIVILDHAVAPGADLAALVARAGHDDRIRVVAGGGRGPACARAFGAHIARGDIVLFLDDDVLPAPSLVTGHLRAHARHDHAVVVGSMPVTVDAYRRAATARVYARDYAVVVARYRDADAVLCDLWGGNVSIRRDDCLPVEMTAGHFGYGQHEDRDLGLRCREAGLTGVFDARLRAEHRYSRSAREFLDRARDQVDATRTLHALHQDALGPWQPDLYVRDLPRRVAAVVDGVARAGMARTAVRALCALGTGARRARARRWEDRSLWLARAIVQHEAARTRTSGHGERRPSSQRAISAAIPATIMTRPSTT